uniref:Lysophospholipid acyltransferase 1-like n=1 Tax=Rhizophora mucronata TaxID=61149 RepID=A0A2P2IS50_RHIMU
MFRGHDSSGVIPPVRPESTRQAALLGRFRGSTLVSLIWVLFESPLLGAHVNGLRFNALVSALLWPYHVPIGIWLSHWLPCILHEWGCMEGRRH